MSDGPDVRPEDAVQIAQRALAKANEHKETIEQLQERVVALEAAAPDRGEYETLDRPTKVGMVREHLVEKARVQNGKAAIDYNGVKWEVFDGTPSADHCYTLMQKAAQAQGFTIRDQPHDNRQLLVDIDSTNPELGFSHANKDVPAGDL